MPLFAVIFGDILGVLSYEDRDKAMSEEKVLILTRKVLHLKRDPTLLILQPLTKDRHQS